MLHQEFIIHPVGQGFFYSGLIKYKDQEKFRMVFDCGSKTAGAGQEEVDLYKDAEFLKGNVIDLLVISHFDQDHVNHIGLLLKGGVKLKKLVMPFITYTERLFLVLKHVGGTSGYKAEDDFYLRFVLDPLAALNENLDDDSEIFLMEGGEEKPIPDDDSELEPRNNDPENNETRFVFDFVNNEKQELNVNEPIFSKPIGRISKIDHSKKGFLSIAGKTKIMEFIFYRRALRAKEKEFYKRVEELFFKEFKIDNAESGENLLVKLTEVIRGISSGTKIGKIFLKVKKELRLRNKTDEFEIENLNTTALCLLHKNLNGLIQLSESYIKPFTGTLLGLITEIELVKIQKFVNAKPSRIETLYVSLPYWHVQVNVAEFLTTFPNVLLTADCFLKTAPQVTEFENHYRSYWNDFWLFQIPHHGSEKNADQILFKIIPKRVFSFINYGIGNSHDHPSAQLINDMVVTGLTPKYIDVNQYTGLKYSLNI